MFQRLLQDALDGLLREHLRRHLFAPLPVDFGLEDNITRGHIELRLIFFNPEGEHIFGFDQRVLRRQGHRPQDLDRMIPEFIQHAYHNTFREMDDRLLMEVHRAHVDQATMGGVNDLVGELRRYYQEATRAEPYFSLRRLEDQEEYYARQLNYAPGTNGIELRDFRDRPRRVYEQEWPMATDQSLNLYRNEVVTPEVIQERSHWVRGHILNILTGREDPQFFTRRAERHQALVRLEHPALSYQVRRRLDQEGRGRRRTTMVTGCHQTAMEVRARTEEANRAVEANRQIVSRLWGQEVRRRLENDLMFGMGWDVAGRDERLTPAERAAAEDRGMKLLLENLTRAQREQYAISQSFYVIGGTTGRTYEITRGKSQNVWHVDPETKAKIQGYCFLPAGNLCIGDTMLTQKIALELEEKEALAVAIKFGGRNNLYGTIIYDDPYT